MDTLQFTRGVTELDIDMFRFPLCDQKKLAALEKNNMQISDLNAYRAAIGNIELYGSVRFSWIPFSFPDAMIAPLSDFILSLVEAEVAVVCSLREDGVKLSARSEDPAVSAGGLLYKALGGIGSGGGHASMGGGFIAKNRLPELGHYPREAIISLILKPLALA